MQVIALTEELLATAQQSEIPGSDVGAGKSGSSGLPLPKVNISLLFVCICCGMLYCVKMQMVIMSKYIYYV